MGKRVPRCEDSRDETDNRQSVESTREAEGVGRSRVGRWHCYVVEDESGLEVVLSRLKCRRARESGLEWFEHKGKGSLKGHRHPTGSPHRLEQRIRVDT